MNSYEPWCRADYSLVRLNRRLLHRTAVLHPSAACVSAYWGGKLYNETKREEPNPSGANQHSEVNGQNAHQPKTSEVIAEQYGVDESTVRRHIEVGGVGRGSLVRLVLQNFPNQIVIAASE